MSCFYTRSSDMFSHFYLGGMFALIHISSRPCRADVYDHIEAQSIELTLHCVWDYEIARWSMVAWWLERNIAFSCWATQALFRSREFCMTGLNIRGRWTSGDCYRPRDVEIGMGLSCITGASHSGIYWNFLSCC